MGAAKVKANARRAGRQPPENFLLRSKRRRRLWIGLALGGIAIILTILVVRVSQPQGLTAQAPPSGAVGTRVGDTVPDFRLVDTDGRTVTRSSLVAGKPGLMFFTATWCLPCIEGLRHLTRFQQDVGGSSFNILVVFVDPRETDDDLRAYRGRYGFPGTWHYALDRDGMVMKYSLRYLDTKYVLDRNGVIRYTDYSPADYNTWVRALATVGIAR